ncbi:SDR family NAD(P)-dependent oxidoreductase [Gracilibacillus alcaliphilus]|uniref:SDR family NAD(P)-dependent oxidoreductase n=1 Tax=Gracilibacillus alcaliphilus TaxID=1401441 RepID=UPI0019582A3F|nr:SDR family oxidoreductase [Gracilibacillus alcaliphilus]MBM7676235.1 3-oxoacyl-[acyl-carrier protein] reductase [Gracilibacillus alcaliphilus]
MVAEPSVVLIVGGAAGIGKAAAEDRLKKGDKVVFTDINEAVGKQLMEQWQAQGYSATFIQQNVTSWTDTEKVAAKTIDMYGRIDILIVSAGVTSQQRLEDITYKQWCFTLDVNLTGLFYSLKAVIPEMIRNGGGNIVIVGSGSAITGSGGGIHYATSKGGAFGLMRAVADQFSDQGIHINLVAPRVIATEMLDVLYPTEEAREELRQKIPIKQLGTLEDTTNAINFLASEASRYMQAQVMLIDGGRTYLT